MKIFLLFLILVSVWCQKNTSSSNEYTAKDAINAMNKAIEAQNNEIAKNYVKEVLMPKIKLAAEGGKGRIRYPSTYDECVSRPSELNWGFVVSILKERGFEADVGERTAYEYFSDPPPRFTILDIFWDRSKGQYSYENIVASNKYMTGRLMTSSNT